MVVSNFTGGLADTWGILPLDLTVGTKSKVAAFFVVDAIYEQYPYEDGDVIQLNELGTAPAKLDDVKADVQDPVIEVDLAP